MHPGNSKNESPFHKLESFDQGRYHEVKIPINDPKVVVKVARTLQAKQNFPINNLAETKRHLDIIRRGLGDYIPSTQIVLGRNEAGDKNLYVIQDKIKGFSLDEHGYSEETVEALRGFLNCVLAFYLNTLSALQSNSIKKGYRPDLKGRQIIFGTDQKRAEKVPRIYFVDTYPIKYSTPAEFIERLQNSALPSFHPDWRPIVKDFIKQAKTALKGFE